MSRGLHERCTNAVNECTIVQSYSRTVVQSYNRACARARAPPAAPAAAAAAATAVVILTCIMSRHTKRDGHFNKDMLVTNLSQQIVVFLLVVSEMLAAAEPPDER